MSTEQLKRRVLAEIDKRLPEYKKLLGDVVRIPTDNPPGDTAACVAFLAAHLQSIGLPADVYEPKPGLQSLVSYLEGEKDGPNLVLNGHLDQFPAGDQADWSFDPYSGECRDGKILGRGVGDMKAGSVISLLCLQVMHQLSIPLGGQLTLTLVADEETGGHWGAEWLLENVPITRGDASLNSEPTQLDQILIGHKGKYVLEVETHHGGGLAAVPVEDDAIAQAIQVAQAVLQLKGWKEAPPDDVAEVVARSKARVEAQLVDQSWVVDSTTVNVGILRGGVQHNTIPTHCEMEIDMRPPLGISTEQLQAKVEDALRQADVDIEMLSLDWSVILPPAHCSPEADIVQLLAANVREITGQDPQVNMSYGSTDARFWWLRDVPTAVYGTDCFNIAVADEYILEREFEEVLKVHAMTVVDYLCG